MISLKMSDYDGCVNCSHGPGVVLFVVLPDGGKEWGCESFFARDEGPALINRNGKKRWYHTKEHCPKKPRDL